MELHYFQKDYRAQKEFWYLLCSDFHLDNHDHDRPRLLRDLNTAKEKQARIFVNGDVFDGLLPSDHKRYSKSVEAAPGRDDTINVVVQAAADVLSPFVNLIDMIGIGNHEKEVLKRHNVDMTALLIDKLNALRDASLPRIRHGGYTGFIRLAYTYDGGHGRSYDVFYNHGQGGSSEITKGVIDLSRYAGHINAHAIWIGHKHTRWAGELDRILGVSAKNMLYVKPRAGIITGCYQKQTKTYDIEKRGYQIDYGEEKMRVPFATGGVFLRHIIDRELKTNFLL